MNRNQIIEDWYNNHYSNICVSARNGILSRIQHTLIEKTTPKGLARAPRIIEIGANKGEHIPFVTSNFSEYVATDKRFIEIDKDIFHTSSKVSFQVADVENLPFADEEFDRVIMTCVLHHLDNPEKGLSEMRRVTKQGGILSFWIPNDPGLLYRTIRRMTSVKEAKRKGKSKELELVHALEHRNHYLSLITLIQEIYKGDKIKKFPLPILINSYNLNIATILQIEICKPQEKT